MTKDSIILKVKKLLALANSSNEHEAKSALAKASELMRDHCISEAQVQMAQDGKVASEEVNWDIIHFPSNTKNWSQTLASGVAKAFGCKPIMIVDQNSHVFNTKYIMRIVGTLTDRTMVQMMLDFSYSTVNRLVKKEQKRIKIDKPWENTKKYSHNFRVGIAISMRHTLDEITETNQEDKEGDSPYAMVIFDKDQRINAKFKEEYPRTSSMKGASPRGDGSGYNSGRTEGSKVKFNKPVGQSRQNRRIGA